MGGVGCGRVTHTVRAVLALLLLSGGASAQTQPRIQASDVTYLGTITLPQGVGNPNALAVDGTTLYVGCYFGAGKTGVASMTMPAIGGTATLLTPCSQLPNLTQVHMGGTYTDIIASGILPWQGKIVVAGTTYYDGSGGQVKSHWTGTATTHTGPFAMVVSDVGQYTDVVTRYREAFVGGFQGLIPPEWRAAFGGPALAGGCCFPIIFRTSRGPSASVYDPADVGVVDPIPSKMIVGYPEEHQTLGRWDDSPPSPYYGGTDQMGSVGFPAGSRSVLFTSRHGDQFCYGPGTANQALVGTIDPAVSHYAYCYDPHDALQGNHGPPYRPIMTAYDANDLLAVKNGTKKPWDVQPYAKWQLPGLPLDRPWYLRAGWWDESRRWYLVGDTSSNVVRVFGIGSSGPPPIDKDCVFTSAITTSPWLPTVCPAPPVKPEQFATETTTITVTSPAVGNGKACPVTSSRQVRQDCVYVPPPTTVTCTVRYLGTSYADGDQRLTIRCDSGTNPALKLPNGKTFTIPVP